MEVRLHRRKMQFISVPMAISLELFFTSRTKKKKKQHFGHPENNPDINRLVMRTKR